MIGELSQVCQSHARGQNDQTAEFGRDMKLSEPHGKLSEDLPHDPVQNRDEPLPPNLKKTLFSRNEMAQSFEKTR